MERPIVVGAAVVTMTVVGLDGSVVSITVVGSSVIWLEVVIELVVGDIVTDIVSLNISQWTPEKPGKQRCVRKSTAFKTP